MRKADFQAKIKRIEITNRTTADSWQQAIRVILDDIDLTNENLLELRQFKPNENVMISIEPAQMSLFNASGEKVQNEITSDDGDSEGISSFVNITDGDEPVHGKVAKSWDF